MGGDENGSVADEPQRTVEALGQVWTSTGEACRDLASGDWDRLTDCPGWTVRDQVSHVVGIERMLLGESPPELAGPVPEHVRHPFGEVNEAWVAARRGLPGDEVLEEFREVTGRRLAELRAMPPERFETVGWTPAGDAPYGEFMKLRVFDSWVHEQDIRHALRRPGGHGGPGENLTLGHVAGVMGYVVARKARAPDGAVVVFNVTGSSGRTVTVTMSKGRGQVRDHLQGMDATRTDLATAGRRGTSDDAVSTVRLTLGSEWFWMLACGRRTADEAQAAQAVVLDGDDALGLQVLEQMNFMF